MVGVYTQYFQKSKVFLYRLLKLKKAIDFVPAQTYVAWDGLYTLTDMKFLCLRGRREHSIKSLATSWGYRNPCFVNDRSLGIGHNRYAVDQFPNLSDSKDEFEATEKYWDEYYKIANDLQEKYPDNFLIVDSPEFFHNTEYQVIVLDRFGVNLNLDKGGVKALQLPINFKEETTTYRN